MSEPNPGAFSFYNHEIADGGLQEISGNTDVKSLVLFGRALNDDILLELRDLPQLKSLTLVEAGITDDGLAILQRLPSLERLSLGGGHRITNAALDYIVQVPKLTFLSLSNTKISDAGIARLEPMVKLKELRLAGLGMSGSGLKVVEKLTGLQVLRLGKNRLTDNTLKYLAKSKGLQELELQGNFGITDGGLGDLEGLTGLTEVCISETAVSHEGVQRLKSALPRAKVLWSPMKFNPEAFWKMAEDSAKRDNKNVKDVLSTRLGKLNASDSALLAGYVGEAKPSFLVWLLKRFDASQFSSAGNGLASRQYETWLCLGLERQEAYLDAALQLNETSWSDEDEAPADPASASAGALQQVQTEISDFLTGNGKPSADLATLVREASLLHSATEAAIDAAVLEAIETNLADFTLEGLVHASALLGSQPTKDRGNRLRKAWSRIEDAAQLAWATEHRRAAPLPAVIEMAAHSIATAWAKCGAVDESYRGFDGDRRAMKQRDLQTAQNRYNNKMKTYERKDRELSSGEIDRKGKDYEPKQKEFLELRQELIDLRREIVQDQKKLRDSLSPGHTFHLTLHDADEYPAGVRQAAAWGLNVLRRDGHLSPEAQKEIHDGLAAILNGDDRRFRERHVHLPPRSSKFEFIAAVRSGLEWMVAMSELRKAAGPTESSSDALAQTCELLCQKLPGAIDFLSQYPLRLMWSDDHKAVIGQYAQKRYDLSLKTRSNPPEGVGPVLERWLEVEDRSSPNAMGMPYELFQHPVLAVPLIFREFLHFGGTSGKPRDAIRNEAAARVRETTLARSLLAELAPKDDSQLGEFETRLLASGQAAGASGSLCDMLQDDDQLLDTINKSLQATYGDALDREAAKLKAAEALEQQNQEIRAKNESQTWDHLVKWPELGERGAESEERELCSLLEKRLRQSQVIDPSERDSIYREGECSRQREDWAKYQRRAHALDRLKQECGGS